MKSLKDFLSFYKNYKALVITIITLVLILLPVAILVNHIMDIATKARTYSYIGADSAYKNTISVQGEGKVYAKPDLALVNLSIVSEGSDINDVQAENSEKTNDVIDFLEDFGIEEKDIKTTNYNLYPRYNYEDRVVPQIVGYEITQTLQVKIRQMESIGDVLEQSISAGVNRVDSLNFTVEDEDELEVEARALAIEDAKEKAKVLASQLGVKLIKVSGFSTSGAGMYDYSSYDGYGLGGGLESSKIQTGVNEIYTTITLIYEIN